MGLRKRWAQQLRQPSGWLGWLAELFMKLANKRLNRWTLELLEIRSTDHVLEIGFGPGLAIEKAAAIAVGGRVAGIDLSELMLERASHRNAEAIAAGRVQLMQGDSSPLPFADESFDKAFAVQLIYFIDDTELFAKELYRVMKPGSRVVLTFIAPEDMKRQGFDRTGAFTLFTAEQVVELLTAAGFAEARCERRRLGPFTGECAVVSKTEKRS